MPADKISLYSSSSRMSMNPRPLGHQPSRSLKSKMSHNSDDAWSGPSMPDHEQYLGSGYEMALQSVLGLEPPLTRVHSFLLKAWEWLGNYKFLLKKKDYKILDQLETIRDLKKKNEDDSKSAAETQKNLEEVIDGLKKELDESRMENQDKIEEAEEYDEQIESLKKKLKEKETGADDSIGVIKKGQFVDKAAIRTVIEHAESLLSTAYAEKEEFGELYGEAKSTIEELKNILEVETNKNGELLATIGRLKRAEAETKRELNKISEEYEILYNYNRKIGEEMQKHRDANLKLAKGISDLNKENVNFEAGESLMKERVFFLEQRLFKVKEEYDLIVEQNKALQETCRKYKVQFEKAKSAELKTQGQLKALVKNQESANLFGDLISLRAHIAKLERNEIEKAAKVNEYARKIEFLQTEKMMITNNLLKAITTNTTQSKQLQSQTYALAAMEITTNKLREDIRRYRKNLDMVKRDKTKLLLTKNNLESKVEEALDMAKSHKNEVIRVRKLIASKNVDLTRAVTLLEGAKAEKNSIYSKLLEAKNTIQDNKQKTRIVTHQIEQLKEEITNREILLVKERHTIKKLNAEFAGCITSQRKTASEMTTLKTVIGKKEKERLEAKLSAVKYEEKINELERQVDKLMQDLGIVTTILDRRNIELSLSREKIEILNKVVRQGETQYNERVVDIRLLKMEIRKIMIFLLIAYTGVTRGEKMTLMANVKNNADLRHEIYHLSRNLAEERLKCNALQQEMNSPMNFHRWRTLEGSDPSKKDLIDKVRYLQKKLLGANEKTALEKQKYDSILEMYNKMKRRMEQLPGIKMSLDLQKTRAALKVKTDENKLFSALITTYESEIQDSKHKEKELIEDSKLFKQKYYDMKLLYDQIKLKKPETLPKEAKISTIESISKPYSEWNTPTVSQFTQLSIDVD